MFNNQTDLNLENFNNIKRPITLHTRLGPIDVTHENIFHFESGLLGFEKSKKFGLGMMPGVPKNSPFMILQSFNEDDLCFILFNNNMENVDSVGQIKSLLLKSDIDHVAAILSMDTQDLKYAFVISTNNSMKNNMSINTMAPIFFNVESKTAWQIVLNNPIYNVCEPLC